MSAAQDAYTAALAEIDRVRASGDTKLDLSEGRFRALTTLPPEIGSLTRLQRLDLSQTQIVDITPLQILTGLQGLDLDHTQIADITPLQNLTGLQELTLSHTQIADITPLQNLTGLQVLFLSHTQIADITPLQNLTGVQVLDLSHSQVADITPLQNLTGLQSLHLSHTQVADLRPVAQLDSLATGMFSGLSFTDIPATRQDPKLAELAAIKDRKDRTARTLAYLKTLPPLPDPLPWDIPAQDPGKPDPTPPEPTPPAPDAAPRIVLRPDWRLDLDHATPTGDDLADPIKARLYARLPAAVAKLARFHNHPEIGDPFEALTALVTVPFEQADMLDIHLQLGALWDVKEADAAKPEPERLGPDCMAALNGVLRIGPGVTMDHPDVEALEARGIDYARTRQPATVAEGERRVAEGLSRDSAIATDHARQAAGHLARAGDTGRVAAIRRGFVRNVAIALGLVADAATGHVAGEVVTAAARFLVLHKDAIMAVAPSWGQTGYAWAEYLLIKADRILRDAQR